MHSIFWKIFLSFWVFLLLVVLSNAYIISRSRNSLDSPPAPIEKIIEHAHTIVRQGGDRLTLSKWLTKLQQQSKNNTVFIIDSEGEDLLHRQLPPQLKRALIALTERNVHPRFGRRMPPQRFHPSAPFSPLGTRPPKHILLSIIVEKILLKNNNVYTLLIDNREGSSYWHLFWSLGIGARITIASLLSGIICFFLARYLTIPLQKLSSATHQIASGQYKEPMHLSIVSRKDEIGDLGRDFERMAARIETTLLSQQRLLRDVSHELRSPLARLQVAVGLAHQRSNGLIEPELDRIELEAERLNELISQSLSLARLSNQTNLTNKSRINLNELIEDVIANANYEAQAKHCQVILVAKAHYYLEGNWDLLHSAVENILRNAVRYTKDNTTVNVDISSIKVDTHSTLNIKIRDHGIGVPEADIENLFTPFFRVDEARTQNSGGYGIGLAIADRAINLHKGKISVTNAKGGGLEVLIQILSH